MECARDAPSWLAKWSGVHGISEIVQIVILNLDWDSRGRFDRSGIVCALLLLPPRGAPDGGACHRPHLADVLTDACVKAGGEAGSYGAEPRVILVTRKGAGASPEVCRPAASTGGGGVAVRAPVRAPVMRVRGQV